MLSELTRVFKFGITGIIVTLIDFLSFWIILNLFEKFGVKKITFLKNSTFSNILSFTIANTASYFINSVVTFSDTSGNRGWLPFVLVSLFSMFIASILMQKLTAENIFNYFNQKIFHSKLNQKKFALLVKVLVTLITMITNYLGYRIFVFSG